jgi:DNA-directed RNA polymerase specialized sigma24 family protein
MTEQEIFHAIYHSTREENKAIEQLFKFYSRIKSIAFKSGLTEDDAQCITQEAIIDLVFKIKSDQFKIMMDNSYQRYILKYAKNKALSLGRRKSRLVNELPHQLSSSEEDLETLRQEDLINDIFSVAESKSKRGLEVMTKRFVEGQSYEEIANSMNYTCVASSKNQLHRVVKEVRKNINFEDYIIK